MQASQEVALQEIEVLTQNSGVLAEQVESLRDQNKSLSNSNLELEDKNSDLQTQNTSLKSLVSEMEDRLSGYYVTGFLCTGSMNPYIDCGDEAVWKESFDLSDIAVGTVIAFRAPADCGRLSGKPIAHRVTEIKLLDGEPQYQTQGDNNSLPDPCWIHPSNVRGVLALLRKGARLEDVVNTAVYTVALVRADDLEAEYDAADSIYTAAYDDYAAKYTLYCGIPPEDRRTCSVRPPLYREMEAQYNELQSLGQTRETARRRVRAAWAEVERLECEIFDICS